MRKGLALVVLLVLGWSSMSAQQPLPITQVLLYKNGMAYIVRSGRLDGPLSLTFHPEDMNDVLKSFSAWNPDTNALYSVGYTAGIPASHMLARFPFNIAAGEVGLGAFLMQVKGAELRLVVGPSPALQGKLAAIQQAERVVSPQTKSPDYRLTLLLRDGSLRTVWLSDARSLSFVDPQLRAQLQSYLEVLAEGRQDVTRQVSIYPVPAAGPIRVAYLQQFPLWKTSYRVDLDDRNARIQGWAQIDNPTGESWNSVQVSLLSGSPVSFQMNLYQPLYVNRATLGVPGGQVAAPRQYEASTSEMGQMIPPVAMNAAPRAVAPGGVGRGRGGMGESLTVTSAAPTVEVSRSTSVNTQMRFQTVNGMQSAGIELSDTSFQQAEATQVEDFFEYRFPFPVQLASRQSALLPFVQKPLKIERLSIFNARVDRGSPRLGARIENITGTPFEPGPVTFFESGRYAGEAVFDYVPRGAKQLVSYGIDHDVLISSKQQPTPQTITRLTISRGVAVFYRQSIVATTYAVRNRGDRKTLIIEHPRTSGRTLKNQQPWETTDSFYRFRLELPSNELTELPIAEVTEQRVDVTLAALSREQLAMFSDRETPAQIRARLGELIDLQESLNGLEADSSALDGQRLQIFSDQERLRDNLRSLGNSKDDQTLRKRYLEQLTTQEDQLAQVRAGVARLSTQITDGRKRLEGLIEGLAFDSGPQR
jgi:hypothetical protein